MLLTICDIHGEKTIKVPAMGIKIHLDQNTFLRIIQDEAKQKGVIISKVGLGGNFSLTIGPRACNSIFIT